MQPGQSLTNACCNDYKSPEKTAVKDILSVNYQALRDNLLKKYPSLLFFQEILTLFPETFGLLLTH